MGEDADEVGFAFTGVMQVNVSKAVDKLKWKNTLKCAWSMVIRACQVKYSTLVTF